MPADKLDAVFSAAESRVRMSWGVSMTDVQWWRGAVIYQIYPRSFLDTDGDGVGDLPGIIERLDYVASLGVDAVWIAPFFKSPFGTLDDFDRLLAKAHMLGLKVMIDQVLSHTSAAHAWFRESRQSRDNPKADWYVWADPREDGTAPNNWLSIFGGPAWKWEPRRQQYYLHNFLTEQPDLNFHHPDVRAAMLDNLRFWLDRGVDGFRLDSINFCFHDAQLRDNPPKPKDRRAGRGFSADNPYAYQYHYFNNTRPHSAKSRRKIHWRRWPNTRPGTACTWATASNCSPTISAPPTSVTRCARRNRR